MVVVMSKQNTPVLRFDGFSDEWSRDVLGRFAHKVNDKNSDLSVTETFTNSAEKGVICQTDYFNHQVSNDMNLGGYYVVRPDDFIYNPRISTGAPVGPINRNKLGRVGVVSPLYTVFRISLVDHSFLDWFFKSPCWHGYMRENGDTGARGDRLSIGQGLFFQMPVSYPSILKEQQSIGGVLTNLDAVINQHTNKHRALQQAKTALMQRMFPQEGQTVPELRLDGFSGEWESTIIDAVADVVGGGTPSTSNPFFWDGTIDWYSPNEIGSDVVAKPSKRRITVEGLRASSAQLLPAHRTILYTGRASIGHTAILDHPATTNQGFQSLVLRDGMDTYFIYSLTPLITEKALKISSGSTFLEISARELAGISIPIPPTLEEQQAIGAVFTQLDALIAAEAQYIESLKQAKTALLQRMFI